MHTHFIPPRSDRQADRRDHGEIATTTVLAAAGAAALVIAPTLVALTHGWDYRLAVLLGATLAAALARRYWRTLPRERVADRLAAAFAGSLAAGLVCTYAADWLDWRPLGLDDAVAGTTIGLLVLTVPLHRLLHHARHVPAAASLALLIFAAVPAVWAVFLSGFLGDALDPVVRSALIAGPGVVVTLVVTLLGFAFALRRELYPAAALMPAVAWGTLWVLLVEGGAAESAGALVGGLVGTGLMIVSSTAWTRAKRNSPDHLDRVTLRAFAARVRAFFAGRVAPALRKAVRLPGPTAVALATLALAPLALAPMARATFPAHIASPSVLGSVLVAAVAIALALRRRLYRTALLSSVFIGVGLFALFDEAWAGTVGSVYVGTTVGGGLVLATAAAWRAFERATAVQPGGLVAFLALAAAWAALGDIEPLEYFAAAAALGVWWWCWPRRGERFLEARDAASARRRQRTLRLALAGVSAVTLLAHLVLVQAAVTNATGAMLLAELRERGFYRVSELTFVRAMFADHYLWRDAVSTSRPTGDVFPGMLVAALRYERDWWSGTSSVRLGDELKELQATGDGVVTREDANGRRVRYVYRGSPGERAGVRRGDVIRAVAGVPAPGSGGTQARSVSTRLELVAPSGEVREVTVEEGEYPKSVIGAERVFDVPGRRVGYLELHLFRAGAGREFSAAALRLRRQGIDELVLDLRMNPGGYVREAQRIASVIAGDRLNGKLFKRVVHNERYRDRDVDLYFRTPREGALQLARLFVITSKETCSASEGLVNGLAPYMPVVTVGETTCGKPVGGETLEYGESAYSIISFRVVNARGEGDYYAGLRPVCAAVDPGTHELGDAADPSLAAALHYIRYGRCPQSGAESRDAP